VATCFEYHTLISKVLERNFLWLYLYLSTKYSSPKASSRKSYSSSKSNRLRVILVPKLFDTDISLHGSWRSIPIDRCCCC
jgi:hypothetical protein